MTTPLYDRFANAADKQQLDAPRAGQGKARLLKTVNAYMFVYLPRPKLPEQARRCAENIRRMVRHANLIRALTDVIMVSQGHSEKNIIHRVNSLCGRASNDVLSCS